ncbi:MAG: ferrochelatase [candidate division Zixibacteria bacterium]|nr:ferrochelatase [candidate division Zixibacteria bacterium]
MYKSMIDKLMRCRQYVKASDISCDLTKDKWGVMLLNMGGPNTLDDIEPYLYNLFCDRNIIQLPLSFILQKPLAKFISSRRAAKVQERYKLIGGSSPQLKWTQIEAESMIEHLKDKFPQVKSYIGMRYSEPFIEDAFQQANKDGCKHMFLLPLYPHYTIATTGTSFNAAAEWLEKFNPEMSVSMISHWHKHPDYISLVKKNINGAFDKTSNKDSAQLLFSAHSLPSKLIEQGDPYETQINETVRLAGEGYDYLLSYQSQTGPVKWLGPSTPDVIREIASRGKKEIVIMPVSFVSDHIETLYEIDIEFKQYAEEAGIKNFIRTESFNDDPEFGKLLATLVKEHIAGVLK